MIRAMVISLVPFLAIGCGTPRSETREYEERVVTQFRNSPTVQMRAQSVGTAEVISLAVEYGIKLAQHLIRQEAKKYESTTFGSTSLHLTGTSPNPIGSGYTLTNGGYFIFIRAIDADIEGLPDLKDQPTRSQVAGRIAGQLQPFTAAPVDTITRDIDAMILDAIGQKQKRFTLAFAAAGILRPRPDGETFEVQLVTYTYPLLKAKHMAVAIPFVSAHQTKSILNIELSGPVSMESRYGRTFQAASAFGVAWTGASNAAPSWKDSKDTTPLARSAPIAVPPTKDLVISINLVESSDMKETLEGLAEKIGDIDLKE